MCVCVCRGGGGGGGGGRERERERDTKRGCHSISHLKMDIARIYFPWKKGKGYEILSKVIWDLI